MLAFQAARLPAYLPSHLPGNFPLNAIVEAVWWWKAVRGALPRWQLS
jgi:hypothetical protein